MSSTALDGRGASSHPRSGILTPSSDGNGKYVGDSTSLSPAAEARCCFSDPAMERLLKPLITVKPRPHTLRIPPKTLSPLLLLRRQHLPLGSIDFQATAAETTYARLVEARIKILDLETRMGAERSVLVARHDGSGAVYAMERLGGEEEEKEGLYAVCRLGGWVRLERLARDATAVCRERVFGAEGGMVSAQKEKGGEEKMKGAGVVVTQKMDSQQRRKRAAIEAIQNLVRKKSRAETTVGGDITKCDGGQVLASASEAADTSVKQNVGEMPVSNKTQDSLSKIDTPSHLLTNSVGNALLSTQTQPTAIDHGPMDMITNIFQNIRSHYFEALYKSLGSLAYFAKGPLTRARLAFQLDLEANLNTADLVAFLRSLVLTTVQIDRKYRETAPEIISQFSALVESSDESRPKKARKSKKMKIGKNGLYPEEDDRIRKWWNANKPELDEEQATFSATQIKSHLSLLRTRETQLQMILILEILALEALGVTEDKADGTLPRLPGAPVTEAEQNPPPAVTTQAKKRNKHNLPVLVDVHADRLTIWQSTATDEQQLAEDSQAKRQSINGQLLYKSSSEPLKDFCTDVIVPFFSARIPELCDSINKKLGGPVIVPVVGSSSKSKKRSSGKREQKPSSATTKRPAAPRPSKALQRALSTELQSRRSVSRGPGNMIALMRSATTPSLPTIKREGSEPASAKHRGKNGSESQKRLPLSRSSSTGGGGGLFRQEADRTNRKALVDAQVKDAIAALRKPNREVVGQAMEEADHQRALAAKKVRKTQRSQTNFVIKATPANNRFRDAFAPGNGQADTSMQYSLYSQDVIPPSSIGSFVPSTGRRGSGLFGKSMGLDTSPTIDVVGSTPTKRTAAAAAAATTSSSGRCTEPNPQSSPLARSRCSKSVQPLTTRQINRLAPPMRIYEEDDESLQQQQQQGVSHVLATPAGKEKQRKQGVLGASPTGQLELQQRDGTGGTARRSIYETLGWDDDYDI